MGRPWAQAEFSRARGWNEACDRCASDEFCDRDHCAQYGRGGIAYLGGTYGASCADDPADPEYQLDPRAAVKWGVHRCIDGQCPSCRVDMDCCLHLGQHAQECVSDTASGFGYVCVLWERIQSNTCMSVGEFLSNGWDVPR